MGIESQEYDYIEVFWFFYSVLNKLRKSGTNSRNEEEEKGGNTFTKIFQDDSQENIEEFINNPLSRLFIIFFIVNFGESYIEKMKGDFKKEVKSIIDYLSTQYGMESIK